MEDTSRHSPGGAVELELGAAPIVVMTLRSEVTDQDLAWMCDELRGLLARGERYGLVVHHASGAPALSFPQAREMASFQNAHYQEIARWNVCTAVVLQSRLQRGMYGAYQWFARPSSPQVAFSELSASVRWAKEMLHLEDLARRWA